MRKTTVFIDGIDYWHELGSTDVTVWSSKEAILENSPCSRECGVVKCTVELDEWVHPQNLAPDNGIFDKAGYARLLEAKIESFEAKIKKYKFMVESIKEGRDPSPP